MNFIAEIRKVKQASIDVSFLSNDQRNNVLNDLALAIQNNVEKIVSANAKDLAAMDESNPMYDRLLLNENRINAIADDIKSVVALPEHLGRVLQSKVMPNGLIINKISVPLGVVAVIYESRPNVTIDVFSLCFKSGNACILKGGKEAHHSNNILVSIIKEVLSKHQVNTDVVMLFSSNRDESKILLEASGLVDVCIPRGSKALIDFVRQNATIPIIETGAGVVHLYFDLDGDIAKGRDIINNSKTRRVSVCNALDCLLIHKRRLRDLYSIISPLEYSKVELFADDESYKALESYYPSNLLFHANIDDHGKEFLSYKMLIKAVDSIEDALTYIKHYTSGHSEAIVTENEDTARYFAQSVDASAIYINASTAFTDGGQFGLGAEIGISTQKLHARGPMGLEALTSYKWIVYGNGHIR